jgi:diadenosine tetraphosphatase ApaH/serine/threonine PP2A family protein phosphatase
MRVAILSDIHGNRHALESVLVDVDAISVDETWCLGDVVGYGADPSDCCALVREHASICLAGNHDLAVTGEIPTDEFARGAAVAAEWTQETIDPDQLEWLRTLRPSHEAAGIALYHGSPREPVWEYVLDPLTAAISMDIQSERVACIGHSHVALSYHRPPEGDASGTRRERGDRVDLDPGEWLLNPGSVGQPRDGDPRAAWLVLDTDRQTAEWHRTAYDIAGAQTAIRRARLPESLAERLEYGQ